MVAGPAGPPGPRALLPGVPGLVPALILPLGMEARAAPGSPWRRPTVKMKSCSTSGQCQHVVGNTGYKYHTVSDERESAALFVYVCACGFVCGRTMEPQCFDQTLPARAKCATPPALVNGYVLVSKEEESE